MRYLEINDKNNLPIFEGDELILKIKDKFFGGSYFGKFCENFDIDTVKIQILTNEKYLELKYHLSFFKDGFKSVKNREFKYWNYCLDQKENKKEILKTIEDFNDIESPNDFYILKSSDSFFFRYILGKGAEKINGFNGNAIIVPDDELIIKSDFKFNILINDTLLVELDKEWLDVFKENLKSTNKENIIFNHIKFVFLRSKNRFSYDINCCVSDPEGNSILIKNLSKEGKIEKEKIKNEIYEIQNKHKNDNGNIYLSYLENKIKNIYNNEKYLELKECNIFIGFQDQINLLNKLIKKGLNIKKI